MPPPDSPVSPTSPPDDIGSPWDNDEAADKAEDRYIRQLWQE